MKIATVISNLKTLFTNMSWTSDSGTGTTKFQGVFTYPNWANDAGYPFVVILDPTGSGASIDNMSIDFNTTIQVSMCVNYGTIDKQTEDEKIEESMLRLREAWDYVKTTLFDKTTMSTIGVDWDMNPSYNDDFDSGRNLYKRTISLVVKEYISRA